jgi:hypothetical protein
LYTAACGKLITKLSAEALKGLWNMKIENKWAKACLTN